MASVAYAITQVMLRIRSIVVALLGDVCGRSKSKRTNRKKFMNVTSKIKFKHSGSCGDILYSLPFVLSQGEFCDYYIYCNAPANHYTGAVHPAGKRRINVKLAEFILPLLRRQSIIINAEIWDGQPFNVNLDAFRKVGLKYESGHIPHWYFRAHQTGYFDLSKRWLEADVVAEKNRIIVSRTSRYRCDRINYGYLNSLDNKVYFVGLEDEWMDFKGTVPTAEYLECKDAAELAAVIKSCSLFIGNQSLAFAIAEGLKVPRILEMCSFAHNVIPQGGWNFCVDTQSYFEYAINRSPFTQEKLCP
jgi:hypothetical protein